MPATGPFCTPKDLPLSMCCLRARCTMTESQKASAGEVCATCDCPEAVHVLTRALGGAQEAHWARARAVDLGRTAQSHPWGCFPVAFNGPPAEHA